MIELFSGWIFAICQTTQTVIKSCHNGNTIPPLKVFVPLLWISNYKRNIRKNAKRKSKNGRFFQQKNVLINRAEEKKCQMPTIQPKRAMGIFSTKLHQNKKTNINPK